LRIGQPRGISGHVRSRDDATFPDEDSGRAPAACRQLTIRPFARVTAPEILRRRVEGRRADQFQDHDVCQKHNADIPRFLNPPEQLIDNTELTPERTAELVIERVAEVPA
jgi:hypothetical protein